MRRTALSVSNPHYLTEQGMTELLNGEIKAIEISFKSPDLENFNPDFALKNSAKTGLDLWSFHLPFEPFETINISILDNEIRKNAIIQQSELIKKAAAAGCKCVVIHPSGEPIKDEFREECIKVSQEGLVILSAVAKECGTTLCVEDLPRTCLGRNSEEINRLISVDDNLRVCFDTNHLLGEKIEDFIFNVGGKIATMHISDYDFKNERHWLPGEGDIDWVSLVSALDKAGYNGPFLYELGFKAPATIVRDRDLIPQDISNNAKMLRALKQPTPLGKRVPGLKYWYER